MIAQAPLFDPAIVAPHIQSVPQTLRPYQQDAIVAIRTAWAAGKAPLAALATGGGKTSIFSQLLVETVNPATQRALVLAHTTEIIGQMFDRISNQFGDRLAPFYGPKFQPGIGIVMGAQDAGDARIIVATRQSLHKKRLARVLAHGKIDVLIIDEAHHVSAGNTYLDIIDGLRLANPDLKVAGFTATPKRSDGKALAVGFDEICYSWGIRDGIGGGFLVPATRKRVLTGIDLSGIKSSQGDYQSKQMLEVLDTSNWTDLAVQAYQDHIGSAGRPCLAFFPSVAKSQQFTGALQAQGVNAAHIDANTPKDIRANILRDYMRGAVRVVSNMGVLTEGFDAPATSAILMARPTRSETLYTQIIGRGLRLFPGKLDCLIVELCVIDSKVLDSGTLLGRMKACPNCHAEVYLGFKVCPVCQGSMIEPKDPDEEDELDERSGHIYDLPPSDQGTGLHEQVISLFDDLQAAWHQDSDEWRSTGVGFDKGALVIAPPSYAINEVRLRERLQRGTSLLGEVDSETRPELIAQMEALQRELRRVDQYSLYYVSAGFQPKVEYIQANSDLPSLLIAADSEALRRGGADAAKQVKKNADWRMRLASEGQIKMLARLGVTGDQTWNKGLAAAWITHRMSVPAVQRFIEHDRVGDPQEQES